MKKLYRKYIQPQMSFCGPQFENLWFRGMVGVLQSSKTMNGCHILVTAPRFKKKHSISSCIRCGKYPSLTTSECALNDLITV